jgi:hypothetical protein
MENYTNKLLSIQTQPLDSPQTSIPYSELVKLAPIKEPSVFETAIKKLAHRLPFKTESWPSFGSYAEDHFMVELGEFTCNLCYCERGSCTLRSKCTNIIDLVFEVFRVVFPNYTEAARTASMGLERFADQRLLIWLRMSSEIYYMYQVNEYFGFRAATYNVTWMCEELVRMGQFVREIDAFESKEHILKGLIISGMPHEYASRLYQQLKDA